MPNYTIFRILLTGGKNVLDNLVGIREDVRIRLEILRIVHHAAMTPVELIAQARQIETFVTESPVVKKNPQRGGMIPPVGTS